MLGYTGIVCNNDNIVLLLLVILWPQFYPFIAFQLIVNRQHLTKMNKITQPKTLNAYHNYKMYNVHTICKHTYMRRLDIIHCWNRFRFCLPNNFTDNVHKIRGKQ